MVVEGVATAVYLVVAIEVGIHEVTTTPLGTQGCLVYLSKILIHLVVALGDAQNLVTPDFAYLLALVPIGAVVGVGALACRVVVLGYH